jgi:uncharacterized protein
MHELNVNFDRIWPHLIDLFPMSRHSLHGPDHWERVETNGIEIARETGADEIVVRLFAVFHDVQRHHDGYDPEHGVRAAKLATELHGNLYYVGDDRLTLLREACRLHHDGHVSDDPTMGACWDADRLDLPRVGIIPDPRLMSTVPGKNRAADFG